MVASQIGRTAMTKQDYEKIAEVLKNYSWIGKHRLVNSFVEMLKADNPRFDAERFKTACGTGRASSRQFAKLSSR